jgi:hypothetical protein
VLDLLDQNTMTGQGLKAVMEGLLGPLFGDLSKAGPAAKELFQGMVIGALHVTIVLLKLRRAFLGAFGGTASQIDWVKVGMVGLLVVAGLIAVAFTAAAAVIGVLRAAVAAVGAVITGVIGVVATVVNAWIALFDYLTGLDYGSIAKGLIDGLVNGIKSGAGFVAEAIKGLGAKMLGSLKGALGIASPSKRFAELGRFSAEGFSIGVDEGTPEIERAVEGMVSLPSADRTTNQVSQRSAGNNYIFHITGVQNAQELKDPGFLERLADVLERAALAAGVPLSPEPT